MTQTPKPNDTTSDNDWKLDSQIMVDGRFLEIYTSGNRVKLQYKDTGKVLFTDTLPDTSSRTRYRHIVEKITSKGAIDGR